MHIHEKIDTCSEAVKSQADKCSKTLVPLYAGQPVATYDTLRKLWVPATVICILPWSSYLVCTSNGSTYCRMQRHLCECSVKAANTVPSGTTATLQALSSHHFLAAQPASPTPAPCMQPTSAAPATLASSDETGSSCSCHASCPEECPSTKVCDIPCHTCAATKIWLCPHGTKMPDPGDLGTVDPDCPWTLIAMCCHHTSPINCVVNHCCNHNLKKAGCHMIKSFHLDLRSAPTDRPGRRV